MSQSHDIGRTAQAVDQLDRALGVEFQRFRIRADVCEVRQSEISGCGCARPGQVVQVGGDRCHYIFVAHELVGFTSCSLHGWVARTGLAEPLTKRSAVDQVDLLGREFTKRRHAGLRILQKAGDATLEQGNLTEIGDVGLEATTPLLDKARGEYEKLTKASTDARSKLQANTPLLDEARGEYEGLKKATSDALSKLERITSLQDGLTQTVKTYTPLLDKARSEYEELTKRIRESHQLPNQ